MRMEKNEDSIEEIMGKQWTLECENMKLEKQNEELKELLSRVEKKCENCEYETLIKKSAQCIDCNNYNKWEPKILKEE